MVCDNCGLLSFVQFVHLFTCVLCCDIIMFSVLTRHQSLWCTMKTTVHVVVHYEDNVACKKF